MLVIAADVAAAVGHWRRMRRAEATVARVRKLAESHDGYVPDHHIRSAGHRVFAEASAYWSRMVLRTIDWKDPDRR